MPIIKSAIKRMKQTAKRNERNVGIKRDIKTAFKAFLATPSSETLSSAQSELDTAVKKKLLKKNTVSRRKSRLAKIAKDAGVKFTAVKKAVKPAAEKKPAAKPATKVAAKPVAEKKAPAKAVAKPAAAKKPVAKKTAAKKTTK